MIFPHVWPSDIWGTSHTGTIRDLWLSWLPWRKTGTSQNDCSCKGHLLSEKSQNVTEAQGFQDIPWPMDDGQGHLCSHFSHLFLRPWLQILGFTWRFDPDSSKGMLFL